MSFDTENNENIVKDSKSDKEVKSPGRLAAEERAERIRAAEEYRRKLEAEQAPVQPKKTKVAEQKEQARLEKIAQEKEAQRAFLEEQRLESERRITAAREKLSALTESIEKTESAPKEPLTVKVEATVSAPAKKVSPVKLKNLVVHIPVQSFSVPCEVKETKSASPVQPAFCQVIPPMMPPMMPMMPMMPMQAPVEETEEEPAAEEKPVLKASPVAKPKPKLQPLLVKHEPFQPVAKEDNVKKCPIKKPVITYGASLSAGGWESEIYDAEAASEVGVKPQDMAEETAAPEAAEPAAEVVEAPAAPEAQATEA